MPPDASEAIVDLTLPSDPRYLALVRIVVAATAGAVPSLSEARIADLKLVATELFTNAMEANWRSARVHQAEEKSKGDPSDGAGSGGWGSLDSAPVHLTCRATATRVTVTVVDSGPGLDATDEPHPPVQDPSRLDHERGLGIPLIQYLADEVDFVSDGDGTRATAVLADHGESRENS